MSPARPDGSAGTPSRPVAKGDRSAFNLIVRRHQEPLYRFIRRYVGDADEAYDLLQETFVSAWQAVGRYDPARPAAAWLRRIALNKCRDWSRRRAVRRFFYGAAPLDETQSASMAAIASEAEPHDEEALSRLDRAIAALPGQLKEPLLLTVFEGMSQAEAGHALGISAKAVETRVYRARKLLAETLRAAGKEVEDS